MQTRWLTTLVLGLTLSGPLAPVHAQTRLDAHRTLGAPHTFQNLTIFPVYDPDARAANAYITLDEGLKAKTVQVQESKDGGDIRLKAQESNFYADRTVAQAAAHVAGRAAAAPAARVADVSAALPAAVSSSSRVSSGQQGVWDKVAEKNARFKTESSTGTYRNTLTLAGGDAKRSIPVYDRALASSLGSDPHLVGVVACVNGKVIACDLFTDPALLHKLWPKLLRSDSADAVEKAPAKGRTPRAITADQVKAFYAAATDAKTTIENRSEASTMLRLESKEATTYRLLSTKQAAGGSAGPLHEAVLHK